MSYLSHLPHIDIVHRSHTFSQTEASALYITNAVRAFALAMIGIYLPLFIIQHDGLQTYFNGDFLESIRWVIVYFIIRHLFFFLGLVFLSNFIFKRLGFRKAILIGQVFLVAFCTILFFSRDTWQLLLVAALFEGFAEFFYWIPYHIFFVRKAGEKGDHFGKSMGFRIFLHRIMIALGPLLGGIIISLFGFGPLFITSTILGIVAAIPVLTDVKEGKHHEHNVMKIFDTYALSKKYMLPTVTFIGEAMESITLIVFRPILFFAILASFAKIGILSGVTLFLSAISVLLVGKFIDKDGGRFTHAIGSMFNAGISIIRMFVATPLVLYGTDVVDRISNAAYVVPLGAQIYEKAKKHDDSEYILFRETVLHPSIIMVLILLLILLSILPNWQWVFIVSAIGALLTHAIFLENKNEAGLVRRVIKMFR